MADKHEKDANKPREADVDEERRDDEDAPDSDALDSESESSDDERDQPSDSRQDDLDEDDSDEDDSDEDEQPKTSAAAASTLSQAPHSKSAMTRAASRAAEAHDHGLAHITPVKLLLGVFGTLTVLTVATVAVTAVDLGSQGNFIIAMIIATIKAGLVMAFFMHLVWDKKFNLTVFLSSFLFVLLFLSLSLTDRNEYQFEIDAFEQANPELLQSKAVGASAPAAASAAPTP